MSVRIIKEYSITRMISIFLIILFLITVYFSVFYYASFARIAHRNNLDFYLTNTKNNALDLSGELSLIQQQLRWIATDTGNSSYWITDNAYEQMLHKKNISNGLYRVLHNSNNVDAALIIQRNSHVMIESHKMPNEAFMQLLNIYNDRRTIKPVSPNMFSINQRSTPSHLIIHHPVSVFNTSMLLSQTVANAYMAVSLEQLLKESSGGSLQCLGIASNDTLKVCYTDGIDFEALPESFSISALQSNQTIEINGIQHTTILESIDYYDLYLLCLIPQHLLMEQMQPLILKGILLLLFMLILTIAGISTIKKLIHRPICDIVNDMKHIREGNYDYRLKTGTAKEMQEISSVVNNILNKLEERTTIMTENQKNLYELRLMHHESQFLALQSQINPHFLYNTLECVRSIAQSFNNLEIQRVLSAMIGIYRYSSSSIHMGTLESEFKCGENYAEIMRIRFGYRYQVDLEMDEGLASVRIPKMVLQPLLENAVNHGLADKNELGCVTVRCTCERDTVVLSVRDNGKGISPERLSELHKCLAVQNHADKQRECIGLYNVHQRLRREFGDSYGLIIESIEGEYTEVSACIPYTITMGKKGVAEE